MKPEYLEMFICIILYCMNDDSIVDVIICVAEISGMHINGNGET